MKRKMVLTATASLMALMAMGTFPTSASTLATDTAAMTATGQSIGAVTLDASSYVKFKASVETMKASLSSSDAERLETAFDKLAATTMEPAAGGQPEAAGQTYSKKASGQSSLEKVYDKLGSKLDGKTFEEIIALAG